MRSSRGTAVRRAWAAVVIAGVLALAACGGGDSTTPEEAIAELNEACAAAASELAGAAAPDDASTEDAFRAAHQSAVGEVRTATRETREHVDDPALARMQRMLDAGFPVVRGGWTERSTAAQTLGSINRIDRHANAAGVPACAAGAWRVAEWEAIYERHTGERPSEEAFRGEVEALCATTLRFSTLGQPGAVGAAAAAATATSGLSTFVRELRDVVPSGSLQAEYFALVGAAAEFQEAVPDVPSAVDPSVADAVQARIELAAADTQAAAEALGVEC